MDINGHCFWKGTTPADSDARAFILYTKAYHLKPGRLCRLVHGCNVVRPSLRLVDLNVSAHGRDMQVVWLVDSSCVGNRRHACLFAGITDCGRVINWGDFTADRSWKVGFRSIEFAQSDSRIISLCNTYDSFAALREDGTVETWGDEYMGSDSRILPPQLNQCITQLCASDGAFAAITTAGSVVTWGDHLDGGDSSAVCDRLQNGVVRVFSSGGEFAAVKADGTVVIWGGNDRSHTEYNSCVLTDVIYICGGYDGWAALTAYGRVLTWPHKPRHQDPVHICEDVITIFCTKLAWAVLKSDGSVFTWGHSSHGGDSQAVAPLLTKDVIDVCATEAAFAATRADGSVVSWGSQLSGGDSSNVDCTSVIQVAGSAHAFAAVKADGSVVTWGAPNYGGDLGSACSRLRQDVLEVRSAECAFAALMRDGSVVTWGQGGNLHTLYELELNVGMQTVCGA